MKKQILFLCTHNSCRSQMAEALANHFLVNRYQAFSAGTEATRVNPLAIRVLSELGIDTTSLRSKTMDEFVGHHLDHVVTLCSDTNEKCPIFFGGVQRLHRGFDREDGLRSGRKMFPGSRLIHPHEGRA